MSVEIIYLDMDGVVVNHFKSFLAIHNFALTEQNWPAGLKKARDIVKLDGDTFDAPIIEAGEPFWASMEPYPWFAEFWAALNAIAPVCYLTSPEYGSGCAAGKLRWIAAQHGPDFDSFILTSRKELLARPNAVLIDDSLSNIEKFTAAGGRAILFERPWNTIKPIATPHLQVLEALRKLA